MPEWACPLCEYKLVTEHPDLDVIIIIINHVCGHLKTTRDILKELKKKVTYED